MERAYREDIDYYEERATGLLASATDGTPEALAAFEEAGAALTVGGARDTVARRHGLISWASLERHLPGLRERDPFARAYAAIEAQDVDALAEELDRGPRDRDGARHQRQRPARDGDRDLRRAARLAAARARRGSGGRERPRLDGAAPGGVRRRAGAGADAARRRGARRRVRPRRRRHAARRRAVLGSCAHRRAARDVGRAPAQPPHGGGPRPGGPRRGAARHAAGRRAARVLPAALGLPALAAVRRSAGDRRRGAGVGRPQRPGRRPRRARRAWCSGRRRRLPRDRR